MQIDKKGDTPIYEISGKQRRTLKKKLYNLKSVERNWDFTEDMYEIYGFEGKQRYTLDEIKSIIQGMELKLSKLAI